MYKRNGITMLEVPADLTIALPKGLFKPCDRVALFAAGDTLVIKKLESPALSEVAKRSTSRPMPLRQIVKEIRAHRRLKRR